MEYLDAMFFLVWWWITSSWKTMQQPQTGTRWEKLHWKLHSARPVQCSGVPKLVSVTLFKCHFAAQQKPSGINNHIFTVNIYFFS